MALLPILVMFALAYLFLVRPQQRRVKQQRELVRAVGVGAEVQTIGGLVGRVVDADDTHIKLEACPGVVLTFVRAAIGQVLEYPPEVDLTGDGPGATSAEDAGPTGEASAGPAGDGLAGDGLAGDGLAGDGLAGEGGAPEEGAA